LLQYGVDVDGDGQADYVQGGAYGGFAANGYSSGFSPQPTSDVPAGVQPPPNLPAGARFQDTVRGPHGAVIDRYVVPQRGTVPVRSVVPEQQDYQVKGTAMVPETRHIQVPKQIMVPEQYTVMVPQVRTRMVPKTITETKSVTVQRPVQTVQNMTRTVNKVVEGQKIVQSHQIIEYERPKMIQGKFLGMKQAGISEVGVQWTGQYYQQGARGQKEGATAGPVQYVQGGFAPSSSVQYASAGGYGDATYDSGYGGQAPVGYSGYPDENM